MNTKNKETSQVPAPTQEKKLKSKTHNKQAVTNYSQEVLDYQGRANGFLTYAQAWSIWIGLAVFIFSPMNNDQTILAPEAPQVIEEPLPAAEETESPVIEIIITI